MTLMKAKKPLALLLALLMGNDGEGMAEKAKKFRVCM